MVAAITLQQLGKRYRRGEGRTPIMALDALDLAVPVGQVVALLGGQGAGKTTTLRLLGGAARPTSGRILLNGHDLSGERALARQQIATLLAEAYGPRRLSVRQTVARTCGEGASATSIERTLADLDLDPWRETAVGDLSHGARRLLGLALTASGGAPILALDEPFAGLDRHATERAGHWLRRLATEEGRTIVLASGRPELPRGLCDRALVLERGTLVADVALAADPARDPDDGLYRVRVRGHLGGHAGAWFADLTVTNIPDGTAEIAGQLADQAALYGLLARIQNLGLPLLAIERGPPDPLALALSRVG